MNTKRALILAFAFAGAVLVLAARSGEKAAPQASETEASIRTATNIVFRKFTGLKKSIITGVENPAWEQFVVIDPVEVRRLISTIHLGAETGNAYEFTYQAAFQSSSGSIHAQLSDHYFVVADPPGPNGYRDHTYQMPKEFYAEFCKLAGEHHWDVK